MKTLFVVLFVTVSFNVYAQDFILRAGNEVYRYDENANMWSEKPLPLNAVLHSQDSIKSYTSFTLEVTRNLKNYFGKRLITYIKYPDGVRIDSYLVEQDDCYSPVNTSVITQSYDDTLTRHLIWIQQNTENNSELDVKLCLYNNQTWSDLEDNGTVLMSSPVTISILNNEPFSVYAYILWKDTEWSYFFKPGKCVRISPFSIFEDNVNLTEPLGEQRIILICSKENIPQKYILSLLNNKSEGKYEAKYNSEIGYAYKQFRLSR